MILDGSLKLVAVLSGNITSSQPEVTVSYVVWNRSGQKSRPSSFRVALNSTTDVTILAAPAQQGEALEVIDISIYNKDSVSSTVIVKTTDGTTARIINQITLGTLETLYYDGNGSGWYATTVAGARK